MDAIHTQKETARYIVRVDKGHGPLKIRDKHRIEFLIDFPYVGEVFSIRRLVTYLKINKETEDEAKAEPLVKFRGYWSIENSFHGARDVTFDEDLSQIRTISSSSYHIVNL